MKTIISLYLRLSLSIALVLTILELMGVADFPLFRVWIFVWLPWVIAIIIDLLIHLSDWLKRRTYF